MAYVVLQPFLISYQIVLLSVLPVVLMNASVWIRSFVFVECMVSAASVRFGVYSLFLLRFVRYEIVCWE